MEICIILKSKEYFLYFYIISLILGIILVVIILNGKSNPSYKISWIVPILILPIFGGTFYLNNEYLSPWEIKFKKLIEELKKAKHFIFLEYFLIEEGIIWNTILKILKEKAKERVDVRMIYDDVGCVMKLPYKYNQELEKLGIKCRIFNPFIPVLTNRLNKMFCFF